VIEASTIASVRAELADPMRVARALGLEPKRQGSSALVLCPWHAERSPSCSLSPGADSTLRVRCFSCGATGDVLSLVAAVRGLSVDRDFREVVTIAGELARVPVVDDPAERPSRAAPVPDRLDDAPFAALVAPMLHVGRLGRGDASRLVADVERYLIERRLLEDAVADGWAGLGEGEAQASLAALLSSAFDVSWLLRSGLFSSGKLAHPANRLVIPWRTRAGVIATVQRRRLDAGEPRYVFPSKRGPLEPYGAERFDASPPGADVVLCEGAVDVLACRLAFPEACVLGLPGVSARLDLAPFVRGRRVLLGFDNDDAGDREAVRLAPQLLELGAREVLRAQPIGAADWAACLLLPTGAK
jgi:DNA primase